MKEKNNIQEFDNLFKDGLENAFATPPNGVWESISNGLAAQSTSAVVAAKSSFLWVKVLIGIVSIAIPTYFIIDSFKTEEKIEKTIVNNEIIQTENKTVEILETPIKESIKTETPKDKVKDATFKPIESIVASNKNPIKEDKHLELKTNDLVTPQLNINHNQSSKVETPKDTPVLNKEPKIDQQFLQQLNPIATQRVDYTDSLFIPNVVTPNGDGSNDEYQVMIKGEVYFEMVIFDSKMKRIFETKNKNEKWNCKQLNGEPAQEGKYTVLVVYQFKGEEKQSKTSYLKLIIK